MEKATVERNGETATLFTNGRARCLVFRDVVYVFKRSSSRYGMRIPGGLRLQFVCQDGCCDRGLQQDVRMLVEEAKLLGATKVVLRKGQRSFCLAEISGLPVEDVSSHVGTLIPGLTIDACR